MERLSYKHPETIKQLTKQYRFNQNLTDLANYLAYDGKMEADENIKNSTLFDVFKNWNLKSISEKWLVHAVNPENTICYLDTSGTTLLCSLFFRYDISAFLV